MTKRDDESQADMEVGMTTAERRRRRRRGAGLRVPSDNVPRRSSTPPVVAPVPEDPALAMSIAYSFAAESSEPVPLAARDGAPSFENHEGMATVIDPVIDPVSGPVEQADFEMKTREMPAVDLEALGLSDTGAAFTTLPLQRLSATDLEPAANARVAPDGTRREPTDPGEDVELDLDPSVDGVDGDGLVDAGTTLDQEPGRGIGLVQDLDLDSAEPTTIHPGPPAPPSEIAARSADSSQPRPAMADGSPRPVASEASQPRPIPAVGPGAQGAPGASDAAHPRPVAGESSRPVAVEPAGRPASASAAIPPMVPATGVRIGRAQTVALSEDDLEEVRDATRLATQPSVPPASQPPVQPSHPAIPASQLPGASHAAIPPAARAVSTSIPPPMPPAKPARPRSLTPSSVPEVPEIDIQALEDRAAEAPTEFDVDVEGIVDARADEVPPEATAAEVRPAEAAAPPAPPAPEPRARTSSPPPSSHPTSNPPPNVPQARESQPTGVARDASHPPPPPSMTQARESQPIGIVRDASQSPPPPSAPQAREAQPIGIVRDAPHASPPPPPGVHKAPPAPPPTKKDRPSPAIVAPLGKSEPRDAREVKDAKADGKPRGKPWFIELFDEDYLRTLPFLTPQATQAEAEFVIEAMGLTPGAQVLDVGCGYGRHAMELAARGFHIVGLDLSTPLLVRGGEEAHRRGLTINFVRGDMRELDFDAQFDGAYCLFSTFGYFDDETNKKTVANIARALRPGGRLLIEILNRDYVIADLPTRVWWEGDGCVVLEEVELNYFSSRIQVNRSVVFDDGRQLEQEISVRAYSLHEVGKLMHSAGLRVLEVSGAYHTRGRFFGNQSRHIIVLAERKDPSAS